MRAMIVKTSAMGDVAQALYIAEYLKIRQKVETVGWVVEESMAPFIQSYPYVDQVFSISSKKIKSAISSGKCIQEFKDQLKTLRVEEPWDIVFDLQGNAKSMCINMALNAKKKIGYGWKSVPERINLISTNRKINPPQNLSIREEYLWFVQSYFEDSLPYEQESQLVVRLTQEQEKMLACELKRWPNDPDTAIWVVSPGSRWTNKTCRPVTLLETLDRLLREFKNVFFVFVAGSYDELKEVGYFASHFLSSSVVLFQPELPVLHRLLSLADRVIAMDSFVLHLASMTPTATFSFFGPSNGKKYAPQREIDGYLQGDCPFNTSFVKRCPILRTCQTGACLKDISVESCFQAVGQWNRKVTEHLSGTSS